MQFLQALLSMFFSHQHCHEKSIYKIFLIFRTAHKTKGTDATSKK